MKILIAPDSFKETLSAQEVALAMQEAIAENHEVSVCPMADGGEGTMRILTPLLGGEIVSAWTRDPLGKEIQASYGYFASINTAIIELAEASGLHLVQEQDRNPLYTSSFGTGLLIRNAIERGVEKVLLTLGGSATNDGGAGMASALGVVLLGENEEPFIPAGGNLSEVLSINTKQSLFSEVEFKVACDVTNPVLGDSGASFVFAAQKGANPEEVIELESQLEHLVKLLELRTGKQIQDVKGLGAAGGAALFPYVFGDAKLIPGIKLVAEQVGLAEKIQEADIVITGEGKYDEQSKGGKVVSFVQELCSTYNKPCVVVCGQSEIKEKGVFALTDQFSIEESKEHPRECLKTLMKTISLEEV